MNCLVHNLLPEEPANIRVAVCTDILGLRGDGERYIREMSANLIIVLSEILLADVEAPAPVIVIFSYHLFI